MRETRLEKAWREEGLDAYSLEAILGTLRHYGVSVSEESLRQVGSEEEALELAEGWQRVWKGTGPFRDLPSEAALELWDRLGQHGGDARHGLGDASFTRFHAAPLEQKLTLAREAATLPGFHGCEVLGLLPWSPAGLYEWGPRRMLGVGLAVCAGGAALTLPASLPVVVVGLAVCSSGVFIAQASASSFVGQAASAGRATASGLYLSAYYAGGAAGAVLPAPLWTRGGWAAVVGLVVAVQAVAAAVALGAWRRKG